MMQQELYFSNLIIVDGFFYAGCHEKEKMGFGARE